MDVQPLLFNSALPVPQRQAQVLQPLHATQLRFYVIKVHFIAFPLSYDIVAHGKIVAVADKIVVPATVAPTVAPRQQSHWHSQNLTWCITVYDDGFPAARGNRTRK